MRSPALVSGIAVFGLLAVLDVLSPVVFADVGAPAVANVLSLVLGVVTLIGLGLYLAPATHDRAGRTGMWIAVVARVLSALTALPAFFGPDQAPTWVLVTAAVFILLTIVGVVLVRPALARRRTTAEDPAPGALT